LGVESNIMKPLSGFSRYAWGVLGYNLLVILWGAFVRATGSGAGCGNHWPLCNGVVIPRAPQIETVIEFVHRVTSGLALLAVLVLIIWALRAYPPGSTVRRGAWLSVIFILTEALLGAGLVLFEWVAQDASLGRAISIVLHLINTFFLLASLSLTAWWASGGQAATFRQPGLLPWLVGAGILGALALGASGALTALGDTLFPAGSLAEGLRQDFSPTAHFLTRLRVLHPTIAVLIGSYLLVLAGVLRIKYASPTVTPLARILTLAVFLQLAAGVINVLLLAPVWMQLVHLLLADLVWISLVLGAAAGLPEAQAIQDRVAGKVLKAGFSG
jgi:heme A synthase